MIKYKNIGFRSIEFADLELLQSWRNAEELRKYFREYRDFSFSQIKEWYQNMIKDDKFEMFMIIDLNSNETVGVVGYTYIDWINRHCDLHFYLGKELEWIDKTYCPVAIKLALKHAFNTLNMNKVWAEIYEIDDKKLTFFKSLNFNTDVVHRDHYFYEGKYYNSYIVSLLREEYEKSFGDSFTS